MLFVQNLAICILVHDIHKAAFLFEPDITRKLLNYSLNMQETIKEFENQFFISIWDEWFEAIDAAYVSCFVPDGSTNRLSEQIRLQTLSLVTRDQKTNNKR